MSGIRRTGSDKGIRLINEQTLGKKKKSSAGMSEPYPRHAKLNSKTVARTCIHLRPLHAAVSKCVCVRLFQFVGVCLCMCVCAPRVHASSPCVRLHGCSSSPAMEGLAHLWSRSAAQTDMNNSGSQVKFLIKERRELRSQFWLQDSARLHCQTPQ